MNCKRGLILWSRQVKHFSGSHFFISIALKGGEEDVMYFLLSFLFGYRRGHSVLIPLISCFLLCSLLFISFREEDSGYMWPTWT